MSKFIKLEYDGKEYMLGFSNRKAVINAEKRGFMRYISNIQNEPMNAQVNILLCGLLEKHPDMTFERTLDLVEKMQNDGIDLAEVLQFLSEEYANFTSPQVSKKKKLEIVEI